MAPSCWTRFTLLLGILSSVLATGGTQTYSVQWHNAHPLRPVHFVKFGLLWQRWAGELEREFYPVNPNRPGVFEFECSVVRRGARLLWCLAYYSESEYFYIPVNEILASAAGARRVAPEDSDEEEIIRAKVHCSGSRGFLLDPSYDLGHQTLEDSSELIETSDLRSDYGCSESYDSDDELDLP